MKVLLICLLIFPVYAFERKPNDPRPIIKLISNGEIRGEVIEVAYGRMLYQVYKGIPYAAAPQGGLRFKVSYFFSIYFIILPVFMCFIDDFANRWLNVAVYLYKL